MIASNFRSLGSVKLILEMPSAMLGVGHLKFKTKFDTTQPFMYIYWVQLWTNFQSFLYAQLNQEKNSLLQGS